MGPAMRYRISMPRNQSLATRMFTHGNLVLCETLLVANVLKEEFVGVVQRSSWDNWVKVLFVMALVVGFMGGFFVVVQRLTRDAVGRTHVALAGRGLQRWLVHLALLTALYLLYAHRLGLRVY